MTFDLIMDSMFVALGLALCVIAWLLAGEWKRHVLENKDDRPSK